MTNLPIDDAMTKKKLLHVHVHAEPEPRTDEAKNTACIFFQALSLHLCWCQPLLTGAMVEELSGRLEQALANNHTYLLTSLVLEAQRKGFGRRLGDVMW